MMYGRRKSRLKRMVPPSVIGKLVLGILIVLMVAAGAYFVTKDKATNDEPLITHSTDMPDESKANADSYNWRGTAQEPKKIRIQKIGVDAYVQKAGVDQNNKVAVPNNVHLAGWFADSVKPGQNGLSVIAGHVSGRTTDGVFEQLGTLKTGDEFEIELGNGEIKRYKVISTEQVKEADAAGVVFSQNPKVKSQVNLITCGGTFSRDSNSYADRVIVAGELIQ